MFYTLIPKVQKEPLAKHIDLILFLEKYHPNTVAYGSHPDAFFTCFRSLKHDSLTFYLRDEDDMTVTCRYHRFSTGEDDDVIQYLVTYQGYSFTRAIKALCQFGETISEETAERMDYYKSHKNTL